MRSWARPSFAGIVNSRREVQGRGELERGGRLELNYQVGRNVLYWSGLVRWLTGGTCWHVQLDQWSHATACATYDAG
jgi:hypothetical protein